MTKNDIKVMVSLQRACGYNSGNKAAWERLSKKFLRVVRKELGIDADIRFNRGGIAVSGDAILHADNVYISMNADGSGWVLYRACDGRKDYGSARHPNHSYAYERLAYHNNKQGAAYAVRMFAEAVLAIIPHMHECPTCGDILTCNSPNCANPRNPVATCGAHQ